MPWPIRPVIRQWWPWTGDYRSPKPLTTFEISIQPFSAVPSLLGPSKDQSKLKNAEKYEQRMDVEALVGEGLCQVSSWQNHASEVEADEVDELIDLLYGRWRWSDHLRAPDHWREFDKKNTLECRCDASSQGCYLCKGDLILSLLWVLLERRLV